MDRRLYLDANVFMKAHVEDSGSSANLVEAASDGMFVVVASDKLVKEVYRLFVRKFGKN
jgi:predicted nucleic acid-binding protein